MNSSDASGRRLRSYQSVWDDPAPRRRGIEERRRHAAHDMTLDWCRAVCASTGECRGLSWAWTNGPHCQLWVSNTALDPPVALCRAGFDLETHCGDPLTGDACRATDGSGNWEAPIGRRLNN